MIFQDTDEVTSVPDMVAMFQGIGEVTTVPDMVEIFRSTYVVFPFRDIAMFKDTIKITPVPDNY